MSVAIKPASRATGIGVAAAALLIGSFLLGSARSGSAATGTTNSGGSGGLMLTTSASGGKITVTGTGTVSGRPDQLVLSMGVQTSASSVSTALREANRKFERRFREIEQTPGFDGLPLENKEALWAVAKARQAASID